MDRYEIRSKKSLGQNFLQDENIARKMIAAIAITPNDRILEIGPGKGVLTKYLIQDAGTVVAVEIDKNLIVYLQQQFSNHPNLALYHHDILKTDFSKILQPGIAWKIVANLPYHITSPVLFQLFENRVWIDTATLMVQKEVAQRIVAQPGSKTYGILSVFSQFYADVTILFSVSRNVFFPKPEVDSAVIQFRFKQSEQLSPAEALLFRLLVKAVFGKRRKMLRSSLRSIPDVAVDCSRLNFNLEQRPEQITVAGFVELTRQIRHQQG